MFADSTLVDYNDSIEHVKPLPVKKTPELADWYCLNYRNNTSLNKLVILFRSSLIPSRPGVSPTASSYRITPVL